MNLQVAYLTGQSNVASVALSPLQIDFLKSIPVAENCKLYKNFPYTLNNVAIQNPPDQGSRWREYHSVSLFKASLNNVRQYLHSRRKHYVQHYSQLFVKQFAVDEQILLLAGSCGLELYENLDLPESLSQRVSIFAYGAVARQVPECRNIKLIRGTHDWIAALWRLPVDHYIECGHMDYLQNPQLRPLLLDFMAEAELY